ncbi:MAG TPA: GNAT family N-acetyltransferase [Syntrophorhabdaceae bacterium]|nr:GNAT family N-acetyltransferase [Syntrophorhabdaceae bacterium]
MQQDLSIRRYAVGDEPGILKLFAEVFGRNRTAGEWYWQYNDNPWGGGWPVVGVTGNEIVAHYGVARGDLCLRGRRIEAGQSGDAMVRSGMRRNGYCARLMDYCYQLTAADGLKATYGVPNRLSYPGLVRYSGWCKIVNLSYFFFRIGFGKLWGSGPDRVFKCLGGVSSALRMRARRLRHRGDFEISVSSSLPDGLEDLLRNKRTYEVLALWKDPQYLRWRYESHPDVTYLFHTVRTGGIPRALLITRDCGNAIAICDLIHRDNDEVPSLLLLDHIVNYYARSSAQKIEFYGHDAGFFRFVFTSCGFRSIPFSPLVFGGRVFSDPDLDKVFLLPDSWNIAYGDTDVI